VEIYFYVGVITETVTRKNAEIIDVGFVAFTVNQYAKISRVDVEVKTNVSEICSVSIIRFHVMGPDDGQRGFH
jgi:hypothetical protein